MIRVLVALIASVALITGAMTAPSRAATTWVVFIDDLHADFRNTGRIRDLVTAIVRELFHEGDKLAIRDTRQGSSPIDISVDRQRLEDRIREISGKALRPRELLEIGGASGHNEVRYRAALALSAARDTIMSVERDTSGRRVLFYISNGYLIDASADGRTTEDQSSLKRALTRPPDEVTAADVRARLLEIPRAANRTNTTIFTIDPRGLAGAPTLDRDVDRAQWTRYLLVTQDSLRAIADQTGGFALLELRDLTASLQLIRTAVGR